MSGAIRPVSVVVEALDYHYPDGMTMVIHVEPAARNSDALTVSLGQALRAAIGRG